MELKPLPLDGSRNAHSSFFCPCIVTLITLRKLDEEVFKYGFETIFQSICNFLFSACVSISVSSQALNKRPLKRAQLGGNNNIQLKVYAISRRRFYRVISYLINIFTSGGATQVYNSSSIYGGSPS